MPLGDASRRLDSGVRSPKVSLMRIIRILLFVLCASSALVTEVKARGPGDGVFHIRVPQAVETGGLMIQYYLTGPFGGYGSFIAGKQGVWDYPLELTVDKKPAETLKAIIHCPGYQIAIIDVPSLSALRDKSEEVKLKPLPSVSLSGKVVSPPATPAEVFKIHVDYLAAWGHDFFGVRDGVVASFHVAAVDVANDGSFTVALPDFTLDPVVNSFKRRGAFILTARNPKTGNILSRLEPAAQRGEYSGLEIAGRYGSELLFYPR